MSVTGQAVRQDSHVRSAAGIRVIAERHEFRLAAESRSERNEIADRGALNIRSKENDDVLLGFEPRFQLNERLRGLRVELALFGREPVQGFVLLALGDFDRNLGLAMDLARQAIDRVELQSMVADAGANLPRDQRIL